MKPAHTVQLLKMRILLLTQYYPPETGAAQNRLSDFASRMANANHVVTVLTALPSYPKGEIYDGYRGRFMMTEQREGVRIVRIRVYATKRKSFVPRILNYLSFALLSLVVAALTPGDSDIVFVESPPLFLGFSGYLMSRLKHAKFVLNISDLWPESAVALGVLKNRGLIRWANWAEKWLYRHASLVTGQTEGIVQYIEKRSPKTRVELLTNGVSPEFLSSAEEALANRESVRGEFGVTGKFVVGFAGLHGLAYDLDSLLEAARMLTSFDEIHFLLVGDGPEKHRLQEQVKLNGMSNVSFFAALAAARMPEIFTAMDVALIPLQRHELFKGTLPAKLFEAMGAGTPVVAAMAGEARRIIEVANCGICVEPGEVPAIAAAILTLFRDIELRRKLGRQGRDYVSVYYNRKEIAERFEHLLVETLSDSHSLASQAAAGSRRVV